MSPLKGWLGDGKMMNGCGGIQSEVRRGIQGESVQKLEWRCSIGREGSEGRSEAVLNRRNGIRVGEQEEPG